MFIDECSYCNVTLNFENRSEDFVDVCKDCDEKIPGEGPSPHLG